MYILELQSHHDCALPDPNHWHSLPTETGALGGGVGVI